MRRVEHVVHRGPVTLAGRALKRADSAECLGNTFLRLLPHQPARIRVHRPEIKVVLHLPGLESAVGQTQLAHGLVIRVNIWSVVSSKS